MTHPDTAHHVLRVHEVPTLDRFSGRNSAISVKNPIRRELAYPRYRRTFGVINVPLDAHAAAVMIRQPSNGARCVGRLLDVNPQVRYRELRKYTLLPQKSVCRCASGLHNLRGQTPRGFAIDFRLAQLPKRRLPHVKLPVRIGRKNRLSADQLWSGDELWSASHAGLTPMGESTTEEVPVGDLELRYSSRDVVHKPLAKVLA